MYIVKIRDGSRIVGYLGWGWVTTWDADDVCVCDSDIECRIAIRCHRILDRDRRGPYARPYHYLITRVGGQ